MKPGDLVWVAMEGEEVLGIFVRFIRYGFEKYECADVITHKGLKNVRRFLINKAEK